jgi:hypothetical protein
VSYDSSHSAALGVTADQIAAAATVAFLQYVRSLFSTTDAGMGLLRVGGQELRPLVHSRLGLALLALPGADVEYHPGAITPEQLLTARASYINAVLIQSRGGEGNVCLRCPLTSFPYCRRVSGHFRDCCANYKWRDWDARCTWPDASALSSGSRTRLLPNSGSGGNAAGGSASNPITL